VELRVYSKINNYQPSHTHLHGQPADPSCMRTKVCTKNLCKPKTKQTFTTSAKNCQRTRHTHDTKTKTTKKSQRKI